MSVMVALENAKLKQLLERFVLAVGISLMLGIVLVGQEGRQIIGSVVGIIMHPIIMLVGEGNFHVMLFIMASITALYASLIQKYTIDWELMRNTQERMKAFQKEYREAQLAQNNYMINKLDEQRKDMMSDQMEMSKQQFKPMAYISIISIPLFMWAYYYISQHGNAVLTFPFMGETLLTNTIIGPIQYWIFWYFIASLAISQVIRKALDIGGV
ncbi:DUF106 domain-containing protein [Methanohalophilus sp. RSK]|nr:DUF106 domain-containing protein [Methanohalophilus sp. RSK]